MNLCKCVTHSATCPKHPDYDPPVTEAPACGSCGEPAPYTITLKGVPTPACLRHLNVWESPTKHGYGDSSDCLCGRNFLTVRGLREHITKSRRS